MKQPSRKKKETNEIKGTGIGIDSCNECPFLLVSGGKAICNTHDVEFEYSDNIAVPDWCGNKKQKDEKRIRS